MKKPTYYRKLLFIILATSMLPIIVLGLYSFYNNQIALREKVNASNYSQLHQTVSTTERTLKFIQDYYTLTMLYENEGISDWKETAMANAQVSDILTLQKLLAGGVITYDIIKEVSLINTRQNWAISQAGIYSLLDVGDYVTVMRILEDDRAVYWRFIPIDEELDQRVINGNIFLVINPRTGMSGSEGMFMVVSLSNYQMDKLFNANRSEFALTVTDSDGIVIYDSDGRSIGQRYSDLEEYENFVLAPTTEDDPVIRDGKYYNVASSDMTGFVYISRYSNQDVMAASTFMYYLILLLCLFLILVVLVLTIIESRRMYAPIQNVVSRFADGADGKAADEFDLIRSGITDLQNENISMREELSQYLPMLDELFIMKLARYQLSHEQTEEMAKQLGVFDRWVYMCFVAIRIRHSRQDLQHDIRLIALSNIAMQVIPPENRMKYVILNGNCIILVGSKRTMLEDFMDDLLSWNQKISQIAREKFNDSITIGVSTVFDDFSDAQGAFRESQNVLLYRGVIKQQQTPESSITFFDDVKPDSLDVDEYPRALVAELTDSISHLKKDTAYAKLDEVIRWVYSKNLPINAFQFYLMHLTVDLFMVLRVGHSISDVMKTNRPLMEELAMIVSPDDMRSFFTKRLVDPIMDILSEAGSSQDQIADQVLKIIEEEYASDLSIESCAERLNYHPTYIWRVMRNKLGTSFQEYLIKYRMDMARKWLVETDITVNEIAARLRYNNAQNFIRSFKKLTGTTPGHYREINRQ
ncbi:MAG TPA: helix-turn-helix domain-containing protein [Candidatus Limiplasma sp.]|nr:helix-turn-helix domain-containing protein [Candidatus Limiplasma sp.]